MASSDLNNERKLRFLVSHMGDEEAGLRACIRWALRTIDTGRERIAELEGDLKAEEELSRLLAADAFGLDVELELVGVAHAAELQINEE